MIGIFDSGLGGLTVLRALRAQLPHYDTIYYADQAHVPYGGRTQTDLLHLLAQNIRALEDFGAQAIVAACNTSCAVADEGGWPPSSVPVLDLIESAAMAVEQTGAERIGVVATAATARSGSYARHIIGRVPQARVIEIAAPALVPLVESGRSRSEEARAAVQHACTELGAVDVLVLGCTHYPLLSPYFEEFAQAGALIDPAIVQAQRAARLVEELHIPPGAGAVRYITTGDQTAFERAVELNARDVEQVKQ